MATSETELVPRTTQALPLVVRLSRVARGAAKEHQTNSVRHHPYGLLWSCRLDANHREQYARAIRTFITPYSDRRSRTTSHDRRHLRGCALARRRGRPGVKPLELRFREQRKPRGLKADYPMAAPNCAMKRQELAKKIGLGRKPRVVEAEAAPKAKRTRGKAAA
jgi:hypothetical protein